MCYYICLLTESQPKIRDSYFQRLRNRSGPLGAVAILGDLSLGVVRQPNRLNVIDLGNGIHARRVCYSSFRTGRRRAKSTIGGPLV